MRHLKIIEISLLALSAGAASAQEQAFYLDVGAGAVQAEVVEEVTYGVFQGHAGFDFSRHFGAEIEGAFGVIDEEYDGFTESINYSAGVFGRMKVPLNNTTEVFSRIGYVTTEFETAFDDGSSISIEDSGPAFGVGLTTLFAGNTGLRFDYTRYNYSIDVLDVELDVNANAFSVAFYQRF